MEKSPLARAKTALESLVVAAGLLVGLPACAADVRGKLPLVKLPPGFSIEVYAEVAGARSLVAVPELNAVFVGSRGSAIHAIVDADRDGKPERVVRLRDDLKIANGIAWSNGVLYVAEQHRVVALAGDGLEGLSKAVPRVLYDKLPDKRHHGWRYAAVGPDRKLYVGVGAACNICPLEGLEGTILRFAANGGEPEVFARGIRNTVGLDFHPRTGELYFTDNGADWMGEDSPPDELNHAPRAGIHFGFPYFGGGEDRTREFREQPLPAGVAPPIVKFGAHVAALGIHFYRGTMFPTEYRSDAFVAQHGSWNRRSPDGYRIARIRFDAQGGARWEPFAEGWLQSGSSWGRPVDVEELADGSLLVSDDSADVVYRISYRR